MPRLALLAALLLTLAGCSGFPALDTAVGPEARRAPYPELKPLSELLGDEATPPTEDPTATLQTRAAALRAKARVLYGTSVNGN